MAWPVVARRAAPVFVAAGVGACGSGSDGGLFSGKSTTDGAATASGGARFQSSGGFTAASAGGAGTGGVLSTSGTGGLGGGAGLGSAGGAGGSAGLGASGGAIAGGSGGLLDASIGGASNGGTAAGGRGAGGTATGTGGSRSGTGGAVPTDGGSAASISCGTESCVPANGASCCFGDGITPHCYGGSLGGNCTCSGIICTSIVVECDGPEDCSAGYTCCGEMGLTDSVYTHLYCRSTCAGAITVTRTEICHPGRTACANGNACANDGLVPTGYGDYG